MLQQQHPAAAEHWLLLEPGIRDTLTHYLDQREHNEREDGGMVDKSSIHFTSCLQEVLFTTLKLSFSPRSTQPANENIYIYTLLLWS